MADPIGAAVAAAVLPTDADCDAALTTFVSFAVTSCRASGGAVLERDAVSGAVVVAAAAGAGEQLIGRTVPRGSDGEITAETLGADPGSLLVVGASIDERLVGYLVLFGVTQPTPAVSELAGACAGQAAALLAVVRQVREARESATRGDESAQISRLAQTIDGLSGPRRSSALALLAAIESLVTA